MFRHFAKQCRDRVYTVFELTATLPRVAFVLNIGRKQLWQKIKKFVTSLIAITPRLAVFLLWSFLGWPTDYYQLNSEYHLVAIIVMVILTGPAYKRLQKRE